MAKPNLTAETLRARLAYNPDTGVFSRIAASGTSHVGDTCGSVHKATGYVHISLLGWKWLAHRLAWIHFYGTPPMSHIDHINGDCSDNRIRNLRDVTRSVNLQNRRRATSRNELGLLGVCQDKRDGKFRATISVKGRRISLGYFSSPESASAAYMNAKRRMHEGCTI